MPFDKTRICPARSALRDRPCIEHRCQWFIQIQGRNPQSGENTNEFGCAIGWLPMLQIETANQSRQAGAAIESFRNETLRRQEASQKSVGLIADILKAIYQRLTGGVAPSAQAEEPPREQIVHQRSSSTG